jgi:hypothetical protein
VARAVVDRAWRCPRAARSRRPRSASGRSSSPEGATGYFVTFEPMTIARLAALVVSAPDLEHRRLLFAEFLEEYQQESSASRMLLIMSEPTSTGLRAWDALLAGLAEHLAAAEGDTAPAWVDDSSRFLDEPWCYFDLPFFRAEAERETPESFRRRGVLIRAVELQRV